MMVTLGNLAAQTLYGFLQGIILGAVAAGLTLIWGIMKVVNLAHGHLAVLGAFLAVIVSMHYASTGMIALSPIIAFLVGLGVGLIFYYASLHLIVGKAETMTLKVEMGSLLSTFGFGLGIYGFLFLASSWGWFPQYANVRHWSISVGGTTYFAIGSIAIQYKWLVPLAYALVMITAAELFLRKTLWGIKMRAVAQDSRALALTGEDPVRVKLLTSIISVGLAMMGGAIYALYNSSGINPDLESLLAPLSFVIVVLGGLGSIIGTLIGGIIIGITSGIVFAFTGSQTVSLSVAFIILVIVLLVKPKGLFGR